MNQRSFQQQQQQPQRGGPVGGNAYQQQGNFQQQQQPQQQQQQRMMTNSLLNQGGGFGAAGGMMSQQQGGVGGMAGNPSSMGLQQQQQMLQQKANFVQMQQNQGNRMMGMPGQQQQGQPQSMGGGNVNTNLSAGGVNMATLSRLSNLSSMLASSNANSAMNMNQQSSNFSAMAKTNVGGAGSMNNMNNNNSNNADNDWDQFFSSTSNTNQNQQQQSNMRGGFNQNQMQSSFGNNQSFGNMQNPPQSMGMNALPGQVLPSRNLQSLLQAQQQSGSTMYDPTGPGMDNSPMASSPYGPGGGSRGGSTMQNSMGAVSNTLRMLQQNTGNMGGGGASGGSFLPTDVRFQQLQQQQQHHQQQNEYADFDDMMSIGSGGMRSGNPRGGGGGAYGQVQPGGRMSGGASGFGSSTMGAPTSRIPKTSSLASTGRHKPYYYHDLPVMTGPINPNRKTSKWSRTFEDPLAFPAPFVGIKNSSKFSTSLGGKATASAFGTHPTSRSTVSSSALTSRQQLQAMDARAIRKLQSSTALAPSSRSTRRKRDRSNSPSDRSRSNSPVGDHSRRGATAAGSNESGYQRIPKRSLRASSPQRGERTASSTAPSATTGTSSRSRRSFDASTLTLKELSQTLHLNIISKNLSALDAMELVLRFPQLYIPADFVEMKIDWHELMNAFHQDFFYELASSIPLLVENNPSFLIYHGIDGETEQQAQESADGESNNAGEAVDAAADVEKTSTDVTHTNNTDDLVNLCRTFHSDIQRSPQFSYLSALTCNNSIVGPAVADEEEAQHPFMDKFCYDNKLVKFNVRVLVGCGMKDDGEVFDDQFFRKMRILCGRKKGVASLLGTSYSQELDGGNPMIDRSCLLNTARRALYAQCLLDIGNPSSANMIKLAEICYHRPKEEIGGKEYPEQEEISVLYFYNLQPSFLDVMDNETYDMQWDIFSRRLQGILPGPMLSKSVSQNEEEYHMHLQDIMELDERVNTALAQRSSKPPATDAETAADSTAAAPAVDGESNGESADGTKVEPTATAGSKTERFSFRDVVVMEKEKPSTPTILLAPMPLPMEAKNVPIHKQDGLSLRVVPMANILSYSQDDRNERLFEVSLAAELLQSHIVLAHANLIADFLLSDQDDLSYLANARVLQVVKHLREKASKSSSGGAAAEVTKSSSATNTPSKVEVSKVEVHDGSGASATEVMKEIQAEGSTETKEDTKENTLVENNDQPESKEAEQDDNPFGVSSEEAAALKKRFVGACRWFDFNHDRFLKHETLLLILYTSHRNITRADAVSIAEELCKDDKFSYEAFL